MLGASDPFQSSPLEGAGAGLGVGMLRGGGMSLIAKRKSNVQVPLIGKPKALIV